MYDNCQVTGTWYNFRLCEFTCRTMCLLYDEKKPLCPQVGCLSVWKNINHDNRIRLLFIHTTNRKSKAYIENRFYRVSGLEKRFYSFTVYIPGLFSKITKSGQANLYIYRIYSALIPYALIADFHWILFIRRNRWFKCSWPSWPFCCWPKINHQG